MIKYFDILKQYVNTGKPIPEYQLEKVMGMPKGLGKSYFRARVNIINADRREETFRFKDYEVKFFQTLNISTQAELIKNLNKLRYLIQYSENPDELANFILKIKNNSIDSDIINLLLMYSVNRDDLINNIIEVKKNYLEFSDLWALVKWSKNPDNLIKGFIKTKNISFDDPSEIYPIIFLSETPKDFVDIIGKDKIIDFLEGFDWYTLCRDISYAENPDGIVSLYLDFIGYRNNTTLLYCFIEKTQYPLKIVELIGLDKFNNLFGRKDFKKKADILKFIEDSKNPNEVKKLLKILGKYK